MTTPNLSLPNMPQNSQQPSSDFNPAMQLLDFFGMPIVQSRIISTPPVTVSGDIGKAWIVGPTATGVWAGKENQIALCVGATLWAYIVPKPYWKVFSIADADEYRLDAAGTTWVVVP